MLQVTRTNLSRLLSIAVALFVLAFATLGMVSYRELMTDITGYGFLNLLASHMPLSGYAGLFLVLFLENTSIPLPGELFLPLAGYYVFVKSMTFVDVLLVSSGASLLGSLVIFSIALRVGAPRIYWVATKLGISQRRLARNEVRLCGRHGSALIVLSSFVPVLGSAIALPAGAVKIGRVRFMSLTLLGALGSTLAYMLVGYFASPIILDYKSIITNLVIQYVFYALAAACAAYLGYYLFRTIRQKRARTVFVEKAAATSELS